MSVKALAFSPDSSTLASVSHRSLRLWDISTSTLRAILIDQEEDSGQADTLALAFSPDGKMLASVGQGKVLLWDAETHSLLSELVRRGPRINTLVFSPDSTILLIGLQRRIDRDVGYRDLHPHIYRQTAYGAD